MEMTPARVTFEGKTSILHVGNAKDPIQAVHTRGHFFELNQLKAHRELIPRNATVIDVGANVGNHTVFYATHTKAGRIYPFEPNPEARTLLAASIGTIEGPKKRVDMTYAANAVGRDSGFLRIVKTFPDNLGATKYGRGKGGEGEAISCVRLDECKFEGQVFFVKIDVEGMEMEVLAGAEGLVKDQRPIIAVEAHANNRKAFWDWTKAHDYMVIQAFADYLDFMNYIVIPM